MRAGGQSGHAHIADDFTLIDLVAWPQTGGKARQMTVAGHDLTRVRKFEHIAIAAFVALKGDAAIASGTHGRARRRRIIDALVCAD